MKRNYQKPKIYSFNKSNQPKYLGVTFKDFLEVKDQLTDKQCISVLEWKLGIYP